MPAPYEAHSSATLSRDFFSEHDAGNREFIGRKDHMMRFGLNFFPSFRLQDMSTAEYYALGLRLSERADELGYASVKTVEHYFHCLLYTSPSPRDS